MKGHLVLRQKGETMLRVRGLRGICMGGMTVVGIVMLCAVLTGCTRPASSNGSSNTAPPAAETTAPASTAQLCAECGGLGAPPVVKGVPAEENDTQVLKVAVVEGYYSPNTFTVKAGVPVTVTFSGSAKGCVAKPKVAELDKKTDITGTGTGTIELGALAPGTYHFTCGMGANQGTITVE